MDMTAVYAKTAKGREEISSRTHKLGHTLRLVLILVVGKLSVAEHRARAGVLGDVASLMEELERGGFKERLGHGAAAAGPTATRSPKRSRSPAPGRKRAPIARRCRRRSARSWASGAPKS